jgi:hypothetical protein
MTYCHQAGSEEDLHMQKKIEDNCLITHLSDLNEKKSKFEVCLLIIEL